VDEPISPYAATKRAGELLCHTYWHLYRLPVFCLRFFTVYGPRQRPDLAIHKFTRLMAADQPLPIFGDGSTSRDYTYIDDIVSGVIAALDRCDRFRIYNLGGSEPVTLSQLVAELERALGKKAIVDRRPAQSGDVQRTYADLTRSTAELAYRPRTPLSQGIASFVEWFRKNQQSYA
jgi:UDP-glucuronate 4-epimerase